MFQRLLIIALVTFMTLSAAQSNFNESRALLEDEQNTIDIINTYGNSVVAINVSAAGRTISRDQVPNPFQDFDDIFPFMPDFFRFELPENYQTPRREGSGSGFVVDELGHIVTNYHVIRGTLQEGTLELSQGSEITVLFPNYEQEIPVMVVGANTSYDLALLKPIEALPLELADISPIALADSDMVQVGQKTIAIGNPFDYNATVTTGIVSALSREFPGFGHFDIPMIQTDAAINPGNSGGPLLNSAGEVIGINTAIFSSSNFGASAGNIGIGFAVPANLLRDNLAELKAGGLINLADSRPRMGIHIGDVSLYPQNIREYFNIPESGVAILGVEANSPAATAGLQGSHFKIEVAGKNVPAPGDVIIAVDGQSIENSSQLQEIIFAKQAGDTVTVTIIRNGNEQEVEVTLQALPTPAE